MPARVDPPKHKKDWPGGRIMLKEAPPPINTYRPEKSPPRKTVLTIERRLNAKDSMSTSWDVSYLGNIRILRCNWKCPFCECTHTAIIPESWIDEGKAWFVEAEPDEAVEVA